MSTTLCRSESEDASCLTDTVIEDAPPRSRERRTWRCQIARTRRQRAAAFELIYNAYLRSGLGLPNPHGMRVTPYHLLPSTTIFTAELDEGVGEVFSTVSLIGDSPLGLPLERVYPEEVAARRKAGLSLGEVSCLADRRSDFRRFFPVFCALNRWMIQFARAQRMDQVLIAVHPKHARFYTRYMGFEEIGGLTSYPSVCNRPAVALCFDFARNDCYPFPYYENFFGEAIPHAELTPAPMSASDVDYFRGMVDPSLSKASGASRTTPV
jgi:hypothetical protein